MVRAVELGMLKRTEEEISYHRNRPKSSQKGHSYVTILTDIDRSRVLDWIPEKAGGRQNAARNPDTGPACLGQGGGHGYGPHLWVRLRSACPQADIVHDKFHVSKYLGEAVDTVPNKSTVDSRLGSSPLTGIVGVAQSYPMVAAQRPCRFGP